MVHVMSKIKINEAHTRDPDAGAIRKWGRGA